MIDMALLSVIRRWAFRDGMSIREITRRTGLSRNTIRKYLRSDAVEPKFEIVVRPSRLDPYAERLSGWLKTEMTRSPAAHGQADPRRPGRAGIGRLTQSGSGFHPGVENEPSNPGADDEPGHIRAAGVRVWQGPPI